MDVLTAIKQRRSIRKFTEKEVEEEKLNTVLDAARWAPSSKNSQPWEFIVIRDVATLKKIAVEAKYGKFIPEAPAAVAFVTDPSKSNFHEVDGTLATQNFQLAAWALGLGTCWIGTMNRERVKEILGVPDDKFLLTVMPIGYPNMIGKGSREPLESLVQYQKTE